jgi:uncharacterized sulfatase
VRLSRRDFLYGASALGALGWSGLQAAKPARRPNIVLVLADDLGWGDLGSYGARAIRTPALDRMAREGVRMTDFYASANVCTPSRAGLLTGRYPIRTGLAHEVIQAKDTNGLPSSEVTIAEALKPAYATALIGKWHLGHVTPFWPPTVQGFDLFHGLPYSHDMKPLRLFTAAPGVELTHEDVDLQRLTERFFDRGLRFIDDHRERPFFLTLALTAPHVPLRPNPPHTGHSPAGDYGDVVEEVDAGVGRLLAHLKARGLDDDTVVMVTSDNGPWFEGSAGPLRSGKGFAGWDGGYRVPFIVRAPGRLPARRTTGAIAMNIDLLPTILSLAGMPLPSGVTLDGSDLLPVWTRAAPSPHDALVLFNNEKVAGLRTQRWKLVTRNYYRTYDLPLDRFGYPLLFDALRDPGEQYNMASRHPDVLRDLLARLAAAKATFEPLGVRQAPEILPRGL